MAAAVSIVSASSMLRNGARRAGLGWVSVGVLCFIVALLALSDNADKRKSARTAYRMGD